jgi:hypothetical protein
VVLDQNEGLYVDKVEPDGNPSGLQMVSRMGSKTLHTAMTRHKVQHGGYALILWPLKFYPDYLSKSWKNNYTKTVFSKTIDWLKWAAKHKILPSPFINHLQRKEAQV